jgi:hypothetical protein
MYHQLIRHFKKITLIIFVIFFCALSAQTAAAQAVKPGDKTDNGYSDLAKDLKPPQLEIKIPGVTFSDVAKTLDENGNISTPFIGEYLSGVYKFAMVVASVLAVIMIIAQGVQIVTSGGGEEMVHGYHNIGRIVIGLCLVWGSYFILYTINPDLVNFKILKIKYVAPQDIVVDAADEPPATGSGTATVGADNVPYFAQWKGPWALRKPNDGLSPDWTIASAAGRECTTIWQRGCGPTSLAMVLAYYGQNVTPLDTAAWGLGCTGAWQPGNTIGKNSENFSKKWPGLTAKTIKANQVLSLLTAGKPLVYNCAPCQGLNKDGKPAKEYKGHYVVLTKIREASIDGLSPDKITVNVNDPGANETKRIMTMTLQQVLDNFNTAVYVDKQ